MIVSFASPCASQRSLNWNRGLFEGDFRANANAAVLASACSDTRFASLLANLKIYAQGDDNYAQNALAVALCSFLMPRNSFDASSLFDSILRNVTVQYVPFSDVSWGRPFVRFCCLFDLLKPNLSEITRQSFAQFAMRLIYDATAWLLKVDLKCRDNFASNVAHVRAICAQAIGNFSSVNETRAGLLSRLLSPDESRANIYQNGTTFDFFARDALFYQVSTVSNFVEIALWMPDAYTPDQWRLVERAIHFLRQFYNGSVAHREFVASSYPPDQTWLHGNLYNTTWPYDGWGGLGADLFLYVARIPFASVRAWTGPLAGLPFARARASVWPLLGAAFGAYNGTAPPFGPYDALPSDLARVAAYVMRDIDRAGAAPYGAAPSAAGATAVATEAAGGGAAAGAASGQQATTAGSHPLGNNGSVTSPRSASRRQRQRHAGGS